MTEYLNTVSDAKRPWLAVPDSEENILRDLERYTLDPVFEDYGCFVDRSPEWISPEIAEKYKGCTEICGNFLTFSHAFRLVTDDAALISRLSAAIDRNRNTAEYQAARERRQRNTFGYHVDVTKRRR